MKLGYFDLQRHQIWLEEKDKPRNRQRLGTFSRVEMDSENLADHYLPGANLAESKITNTSLAHSCLTGATFDKADLQGCCLVSATLNGSSFISANLSGAEFSGRLSGANFSHANLRGALFRSVNVDGTNFSGCDLRGVDWGYHPHPFIKPILAGITNANFSGARGVYHTKFSADEAILSALKDKEITFFSARPVVQENYARYVVQVETTCFENHQQALMSGIVVSQSNSVRERRIADITEHINFWAEEVYGEVVSTHTLYDEYDEYDEPDEPSFDRAGAIKALAWYSFISQEKAEIWCDEYELNLRSCWDIIRLSDHTVESLAQTIEIQKSKLGIE